jgi:uncharacterized protein YodC (DUF2158 family)
MVFKVGDTVKLKSDGPNMTVVKIGTAGGEPMVWCAWFEGTKDVYGLFPPDALKGTLESPKALEETSEWANALTERSEPEGTVKALPESQQKTPTEVDSAPIIPDPTEATRDANPAQAESAHPSKAHDKSLEAQIASVQALITHWIKRP